jgi:hypothetical protein
MQIEYPWKHIINPIDSCIDALVIRGAMQMAQFFSGESTAQFQWLEVKEDEDHLNRPGTHTSLLSLHITSSFEYKCTCILAYSGYVCRRQIHLNDDRTLAASYVMAILFYYYIACVYGGCISEHIHFLFSIMPPNFNKLKVTKSGE